MQATTIHYHLTNDKPCAEHNPTLSYNYDKEKKNPREAQHQKLLKKVSISRSLLNHRRQHPPTSAPGHQISFVIIIIYSVFVRYQYGFVLY